MKTRLQEATSVNDQSATFQPLAPSEKQILVTKAIGDIDEKMAKSGLFE
jgi:hypothetical protein